MRNVTFLIALFISSLSFVEAQEATIRVENLTMKTYMFSDPNSVPEPGRIYPYFRFDGYTSNDIQKEWKMVILENDYIKVYVCPDIGGKVWGAIEKSTGNEFLYYNNVVKFRDVAMRGPWTSGGLEYNFGDIGHIPTCATPVDYIVKENADGSVSCIVGAIDLPSRTRWNVEINLQKDKAYFQTKASWFNLTSVPNTYYHWMNAAAKASGNLHFIYPGDHYIGHGGEHGSWPLENDRDLSRYENNNFGTYKSYHVINSYSNFFGGYWQDDDFGFGHLSSYDDKPGKKLWIWGLSRQGMIWEDLLTDNDGQYIEFQAGKLFNQAAYSSTFTPFKHKEFLAYDSDIMVESWFPLVKTGGMVAASEYAVMNVNTENNIVEVKISALQNLNDNLVIKSGNEIISRKRVYLEPLQLDSLTFDNTGVNNFTIELGDSKLIYKSSMKHVKVNRPIDLNMDFDFNSAYGLYIRGLEQEKQRMYNEALESYELCLEKEKTFAPAINKKALLLYKKMDYKAAQDLALSSLAIDTYDPEANYIYGLTCIESGEISNAKNGFSIAAASVKYRTASYTKLAGIFLRESNFPEALKYSDKALSYNQYNISAYKVQAISYRKTDQKVKAFEALDKLTQLDPISQFSIFEKYLWNEISKNYFLASVNNELPTETFLELSIFYYNLGCDIEALNVLNLAPKTPMVSLWLAKLDKESQVSHLNSTINGSINLIFPFRVESAALLEEFIQENNNWKLKYYLGLIYWNKGLLNSAQKLFKDCNNTPDDALFYLAKAKLFSDFPEIVSESLRKARNLNKDDWRTALAMINYYLTNSQAEDALPLAKEFALRYPERPALGLSYVEALIKTKQYKTSIQFIEKYNLLPFEGGTIGRDLYHDACIQETLSNLKKKKFNNAIKYAERALKWPENLGVGRPYEVDERLENYIIARAMEESGKIEEADYYFQNTANYKRPAHTKENSKLIFQLQAMRKLNEEQEAVNLLKESMDEFPDNKYLKWVNSVFLHDEKQESIKNEILDKKAETKPYDINFIDNEFELVTAISSTLDKY